MTRHGFSAIPILKASAEPVDEEQIAAACAAIKAATPTAEEAAANMAEAMRALRAMEGHSAEEWKQAADGVRAVAEEISEVPRG